MMNGRYKVTNYSWLGVSSGESLPGGGKNARGLIQGAEVMRLRNVIGFVVLVLLASFNPALAQERFGGIAGVVSDASPAPVPGATVTVLNETTGATRTAVSGADGSYRIPDLEPGRYTVSVELSGFQKVQADNVLILLGRTLEFPATLRVGAVSETVNVTGEAARQIDLTSVTVQHNITEEEIERLPKTRSFQGLALASPGVNQGVIEGGIQVNGASGAENSFTVDGVVTNSLVNGASRQDTVFEYLQEVQVKTGGVDAEYGGALGGVISAVTKSGGNTYRGEAHYFLGGSPLSAGPVNRLVLNPSNETTVAYIQDDKQKNVRNEVGGSIGGPILRDRLFFFGSYSPGFTNRTNDYMFSSGTEPGSIDSEATVQQLFGKLTYSNNKIHANGSMLFTPTSLTGVLAAYDGNGSQFLSSSAAANASRATRGWEYRSEELQRQPGLLVEQPVLRHREGRLLLRQLQRHRRAEHDLGDLEQLLDRRAGRSGEPAAAGELPQHAACSDHGVRHDEAGLHPGRLQPHGEQGRRSPVQGRPRVSARRQRRSSRRIPADMSC